MLDILQRIKNFINYYNTKVFLGVFQLFSAGYLLVLIPVTSQSYERPVYDTRIQFSKNAQILSIPDKSTEVYSAGSREDLNNLEPEAIKGLMKYLGEQYGVDWRLVYAIGYHESGNFNSSLAHRQYNFFGRKAGSGGYASWSTPEEAIRNQFEYLKTRYFAQGLDTPAEINHVYAEDGSWHYAIETVMNTL